MNDHNDHEDKIYIQHILDAFNKIIKHTKSMTEEEFLNNDVIQDVAVRQLEIVGEATKNLSQALREKYPDIRWKSMAGMRDKLIHEYFGVDYVTVWDVANAEVPDLKEKIEQILRKIKPDQNE